MFHGFGDATFAACFEFVFVEDLQSRSCVPDRLWVSHKSCLWEWRSPNRKNTSSIPSNSVAQAKAGVTRENKMFVSEPGKPWNLSVGKASFGVMVFGKALSVLAGGPWGLQIRRVFSFFFGLLKALAELHSSSGGKKTSSNGACR